MSEIAKETKWIEIASEDELSEIEIGTVTGIEIEKDSGAVKDLVLIRSAEHEWYVMDNLCTHDGGPLEDGYVDLEHCSIECERHGAKFNLKTGEVISMPAIHPINTYSVKIENGILYIQLDLI